MNFYWVTENGTVLTTDRIFPPLPWPVLGLMVIGILIILIAHGISVKIEQNKKEKENTKL